MGEVANSYINSKKDMQSALKENWLLNTSSELKKEYI
jgi:hypothetical protein